MMLCNRCAKSDRVAFCLQHLLELALDERAQIGDLDVLVGGTLEIFFEFVEVDLAQIPRLA